MVLILPAQSDDAISTGMCWLTELLVTNGLGDPEYRGGFLGGEFGYGTPFENDEFALHPFCWCERFECQWCLPCECGDEAVRYEVNGVVTTADEWYATGGYGGQGHTASDVPEFQCANCRGGRNFAPNFLHKPTGTKIRWYKYIGRDMEIELHGDWRQILDACVNSVGAMS